MAVELFLNHASRIVSSIQKRSMTARPVSRLVPSILAFPASCPELVGRGTRQRSTAPIEMVFNFKWKKEAL